jgi:hypothetical protein
VEISEFKDIAHDCKDLTFRQIWGIYDKQFNELRDVLLSLGDKIVVEHFTGDGSEVLHLQHKYVKNHCIVYLNNVIQWKGVDYEETDSNTITMLQEIKDTDEIRVVIILNDMLVSENLLNIEHIREVVNETIDTMVEEKLQSVVNERVEDYLRVRGFI